jgi:hypothetical protein
VILFFCSAEFFIPGFEIGRKQTTSVNLRRYGWFRLNVNVQLSCWLTFKWGDW